MKIQELDEFTIAYMQCILFAETDESTESGGYPLDQNYSLKDFSPEAIEEIVKDCKEFQKQNAEDIATIPDHISSDCDSYGRDYYSGLECAGHDFWFTRKGHGVGFWDRDWIEKAARDRLTESALDFGERWVYVGDDHKVHIG